MKNEENEGGYLVGPEFMEHIKKVKSDYEKGESRLFEVNNQFRKWYQTWKPRKVLHTLKEMRLFPEYDEEVKNIEEGLKNEKMLIDMAEKNGWITPFEIQAKKFKTGIKADWLNEPIFGYPIVEKDLTAGVEMDKFIEFGKDIVEEK